jgi:hypothetical protein
VLTAARSETVGNGIRDLHFGWLKLGENPAAQLQQAYVANNPYPEGERDQLADAKLGSNYDSAHSRVHPALQVLACLVEEGRPASELLHQFDPLPQLLKNVRFGGGAPLDADSVKSAIAAGEQRLSGTGRLVIRKSGTEALIRVMAEGEDQALVEEVVDSICEQVKAA